MAQELRERLGRIGAQIQTNFLSLQSSRTSRSEFNETGAVFYAVAEHIRVGLHRFFDDKFFRPFDANDCADGYIYSEMKSDIVEKLNEQNLYFGEPDENSKKTLADYLSVLASDLVDQLKYNFRIVNVRSWKTKVGANFGPSTWHADATSSFLPKLMIYLNSPNIANGTFEFFSRKKQRYLINSDEPLAILVDNANLLHRGRSSTKSDRPMIEITLAPDNSLHIFPFFAGQNAWFPIRHLENLEKSSFEKQNRSVSTENNSHLKKSLADVTTIIQEDDEAVHLVPYAAGKLNIGGGPQFHHSDWINVDEFPGIGGYKFNLMDISPLPFQAGTFETIYSSHCFEHLPETAIQNCLRESRRLLMKDGMLVVKVPNYDHVLRSFRENNILFCTDNWNLESIVGLWPNRGVQDTFENRISMIFCGFWNSSYGHAFKDGKLPMVLASPQTEIRQTFWGKLFRRNEKFDFNLPYHGPLPVASKALKKILSQNSPKKIAHDLKTAVIATQGDVTFNHQTAFSDLEFREMIDLAGFELISSDATRIISEHRSIPGIEDMREISSYFLCRLSSI